MKTDEVLNIRNKLEDFSIEKDKKIALYGIGAGTDIVFNALQMKGMGTNVKYVVDNDESACIGKKYRELNVFRLSEIYEKIDIIIITARINHQTVKERILRFTEKTGADIKIIDVYGHNTQKEKAEYAEYVESAVLKRSDSFLPFKKTGYERRAEDSRIIAWYLPQFHQIAVNNRFHGQGFTEWTNTTQARPLFVGHYQPHIPYDVGYYDLMNPDSFKRQIFLAKNYGIYGFCFHYYWFSGTKLMEKPIELFLKNRELDMPFCLSWATENWTKVWDGGNQEIMFEQKIEDGDAERFMRDIMPYMKDSRYIKINGCPVLGIYKCDVTEKRIFVDMMRRFREYAIKEGFPDLFILISTASNFQGDVREMGGDAVVEFPPWLVTRHLENIKPDGYINPYYNGNVFDVDSFIKEKKYMMEHKSECVFRSVLTSYDNTARRCTRGGNVFLGFTPDTYKVWLSDIMKESKKVHTPDQDIVFVNSWNEWAEGSHLEPDMKYGYSYLQATCEALMECRYGQSYEKN